MTPPRGPFTPWVEHRLVNGLCPVCGLMPPLEARSVADATIVYTHAGAYVRTRPSGNIIPCS